jgi:hypothetical protein
MGDIYIDGLVESAKDTFLVTPAKAGVQNLLNFLDSRFHGSDGFMTYCENKRFDNVPFISLPFHILA